MGVITPSNGASLHIAEEVYGQPGVLPATPTWTQLEPNDFGDFGGQVKLTPRSFINQSRQRRKGTVTDLDVAGGFTTDFTSLSLFGVLPGFMFADWRLKDSTVGTAASTTAYTTTAGTALSAGTLVFASGFTTPSNNGLKVVGTGSSTTSIPVTSPLLAETGANARITKVGVEAGTGDFALVLDGVGRANLTSTSFNFTTLNLIPGEWIWLGGDNAATSFATATARGFYRVFSVANNVLVFDRVPVVPVADAGTGKTIRLFVGHVIKNESDPALIKLRTYQLERRLSSGNYEYLKGVAANTMAISIKKADKITIDFSYVGLDTEAADTAKAGIRFPAAKQAAFNSSSDFSRLRFQNDTDGVSLATFVDELTLTIDNGIDPVKAVGSLGGVDINYGDFMVSGSTNAFFTSMAAVTAVKENVDASFDFAVVTRQAGTPVGWLFDQPLIALGDARMKVEKDKPIMIPVSLDAAAHEKLDHTLLVMHYPYLPVAAL